MTQIVQRRDIEVAILETWHVGTGRGEGQHLDAVVERDIDGLPYLPGRTLRGLIRDAADVLERWKHALPITVEQVFGGKTARTDAPGPSVSATGLLSVSNAQLPEVERVFLARTENAAFRQQLFLSSFQTALDPTTGAVKSQSLRGIELVVPVTLRATLEVRAADKAQAQAAWEVLTRALPLVRAVGAHKTRGHGRAHLSLLALEAA